MNDAPAIARPRRWDRPFGDGLTDAEVERLLAQPLFRMVDPAQFRAPLLLADILRNDGRLVCYAAGDVIVREGDYGSSLFVILSGRVRVVTDGTSDAELGRGTRLRRHGLFQALRQLWTNPEQPEVRDPAGYSRRGATLGLRGEAEAARTFLRDVAAFCRRHETVALGDGDCFGEIAAIARQPRTATVFAETPTEAVELRWQGLRDIRQRSTAFRDHVDGLYRARALIQHLRESPLFRHLDETALSEIAQHTIFENHGAAEWYRDFRQVKGREAGAVTAIEEVIAQEGHYLDGLIMLRSGFCRISEQLDAGHRTVSYATENDVFGLGEIVAHVRQGAPLVFRRSLRAVGYVDVLRVPTEMVERLVLPGLPAELLDAVEAAPERPALPELAHASDVGIDQALLDFLVDQRTVNGTATMLIDTDRCTGCDDCVRACAATHRSNPRFKRHGPIHEALQVTNACMHCADPVCLIGCPTGAIHRSPTGPVIIDDATCIGCATCAQSCPYDNITMVEIRDAEGAFIVDEASRQPIVKATKCDLCFDQLGGPACQRACPHDALVRMDMHDPRHLAAWVSR
ncbi:Fe-S-cluster-containing dehydrogenase component [Tistlia consotensis]|uniref:Fe-S-cluster-containing dehydrogenase component n=1 Tax=Tistlia consotensis USBA 355 TaxID=560819 RepID=A0A1Y6CKD4_9PROT|nr:cyclic nucleotide-binding domain-containing protein [Tistlia consotensis]SMF72598.1 Fe-S-cluster-containing dehydrogenase component [Tistlia consotensis USBA 355]SNS09497.1 Fe-S-cluster-containing dehydrogenase component [Tistlia consotensis]